jgi:hypothetical protein
MSVSSSVEEKAYTFLISPLLVKFHLPFCPFVSVELSWACWTNEISEQDLKNASFHNEQKKPEEETEDFLPSLFRIELVPKI